MSCICDDIITEINRKMAECGGKNANLRYKMSCFRKCFLYLIITGICGFILGRLLPKGLFNADKFPYKPHEFERDGRIYDALKIRRWQNKVPDMSKLVPALIPAKKLDDDYADRLPVMIRETCVAELIHILHGIAGLHCLRLYPGVGGAIISIINIVLLNLPFIIIQRYNRPRLMRIMKKTAHTRASVEYEMPVREELSAIEFKKG